MRTLYEIQYKLPLGPFSKPLDTRWRSDGTREDIDDAREVMLAARRFERRRGTGIEFRLAKLTVSRVKVLPENNQ